MSGMKSMLSVCVVVVALGVGLYFLFPQAFSGASWLLLLLVCPLGMMLMGHGDKKDDSGKK